MPDADEPPPPVEPPTAEPANIPTPPHPETDPGESTVLPAQPASGVQTAFPETDCEGSTVPPAPAIPASKLLSLEAPLTEAPPAPVRRRFEGPPGADGKLSSHVWRRHWCGVGGVVLLAACVCALIGGPWPAWRWNTPTPERPPPGGAVAVIIDPGHGGGDSGAVSQGVVEKDLNLDVGRRVAQSLSARGIKVRLTREDDHFITLEERVRMGNSQPGAVFVSIHFNDASGDGRVAMNRASGIETFYSENKAMSASAGGWMWASLFGAGAKADPVAVHEVGLWSAREGASLAQSIQSALVASTAATDRGIKERSLYVTRRVRGPSVLVEGGFVSHPAEARLLGDPAYRQKLADAIADGIVRYLDAASRQPLPAAVLASLGA